MDKPTIRIGTCDFQASGITCLKMALMLLGMMVLGVELKRKTRMNYYKRSRIILTHEVKHGDYVDIE